MKEDKVMERIHKIRREMLRDHGGNLTHLFNEVKQVEKENGGRMVPSETREKKSGWSRPRR